MDKINMSQRKCRYFKSTGMNYINCWGSFYVLYPLISMKYEIICSAKELPDPELQQSQN